MTPITVFEFVEILFFVTLSACDKEVTKRKCHVTSTPISVGFWKLSEMKRYVCILPNVSVFRSVPLDQQTLGPYILPHQRGC